MKRGFYIPQFEPVVERSFSEAKRKPEISSMRSHSDKVARQIVSFSLCFFNFRQKTLALKSRIER